MTNPGHPEREHSARVEHVCLHGRRHAFPLARGKRHGLDRQLANVFKNLLRALRKVDHHGQADSQGQTHELLCGPGWGYVTQVLGAWPGLRGIDQTLGVVNQATVRKDHPLGLARGA